MVLNCTYKVLYVYVIAGKTYYQFWNVSWFFSMKLETSLIFLFLQQGMFVGKFLIYSHMQPYGNIINWQTQKCYGITKWLCNFAKYEHYIDKINL